MSDVPPAPPPGSPGSTIVAAYAPLPINLDEARKQQVQYKADLDKTRGALSDVQGQRMGVTQRNLKAIDEAISGLQANHTGTYGLDPAVTAALAAGFLNPRPGSSGFLNELGGAMGNAAPVVAGLQQRERDSFQILADLQRKRGEFEAQPLIEQQTELSAREKLESAALKESEKALARAPTGAAAGEKPLDREKFIEQMKKDAEAEIKQKTDNKMHKSNGEPLSEQDAELIRGYVLRKRIEEYNAGKVDAMKIPLPIDDIKRDEALKLLADTTDVLKGKDLVYYRYKLGEDSAGRRPMSQEEFEASVKGKAANAEALAKSEAALETSLPNTINHSQSMIKNLTDIVNHPGLERVVNPNTGGIGVVSNEGKSFLAYYDVLKGEAFIQGIKEMKNTGPISNAEGAKVEKLIGRIGLMQSPTDFKKAISEIQESLQKMNQEAKDMQAEFKRRAEAAGRKPAVGSGSGTADLSQFNPSDVDLLRKNSTNEAYINFFNQRYSHIPNAANIVLGR